ncbi:MAG: hypothetical protein ACRDYA_09825 [Egibacteraceae bacterium]
MNDIGDYAKYALLRALCSSGPATIRLGVIWYLTEHAELNGDGRRRPHLVREGWDDLDPDLLIKMRAIESALRDEDDLHVGLIERSGILPADTVFFSEALPEAVRSGQLRINQRADWFARARQTLTGCNLVFLDPDNGLEVRSVTPTSRLAGKYVTVAEVTELLSIGAGVILYQHCDRSPWRAQRERVQAQLASIVGELLTVRSLRFGAFGARAFFCISVQPDITATINTALRALHERVASWDKAHYFLFE